MAYGINEVRPIDPLLTQFAVEYRNPDMIGDMLFPKVN